MLKIKHTSGHRARRRYSHEVNRKQDMERGVLGVGVGWVREEEEVDWWVSGVVGFEGACVVCHCGCCSVLHN